MALAEKKRRWTAAAAALGCLLVLAFMGWVVTTPEFLQERDRPIVSRFSDAVQARLRQAGIITGGHRTSRKSSESAKSKSHSQEVTGPAVVTAIDTRNRPIADVTVSFRSKDRKLSAKTDKRGRATTKLPVGDYQVVLTHKKYSTEVRTHQQIYGPSRGFSLNITMQTRVAIKGRVLDEEGKPIADAAVSGQRNWLQQFSETGGVFLDDAAYPTVSTDKNGVFRMQGVSIGSNTFSATHRGYADGLSKVEVPAEGLKSDLKLVLKRPGTISGRVVDEAMQPVAGVKIAAASFQPFGEAARELPSKGFSTASDHAGKFELKKLFNDGYYTLTFEHSSYAMMEQAQVTAGTAGLVMVMQRGGEISGTVEYLDRQTTPAVTRVHATTIVSGTTITRTVMSDKNGAYAFQRLPYGSYELSVNQDGFVNEPRPRVSSVRGKPSTNNKIEIYQASTLTGKVVDAFTGDPIEDAVVTLRSSYGATKPHVRQFSERADSSGKFSFERLPGGTHRVTATARDYLPTSGDSSDYTVLLTPGGVEKDYIVFLSQGGTVSGQVVDPDDNGIAEAEVQLYVASGSFSGLKVKDLHQKTDGTGFFEFRGFPIGQGLSVYISAQKAGYAKKHSDIVELWPAQPETSAKVVMTPGGVISGQVKDTAGNPLYGIKITFDSREFRGDPSPSEFYTYTDNAGNYLLEHCTPGRAVLVADHEKYVRQTKSVTVPEGRLLSRQNFKMQTANIIGGTVADFRGRPIADASVTAAPLGKATGSGRDRTNKKGTFEIHGVSAGLFRVEASFSLDTSDGKQTYTFIVPEAEAGNINVPVDCDVAPSASGAVLGSQGKRLERFKLTLRSRLDTEPAQQFRFNLVRNVTNAGGQLRLQKVPRGIYSLKVEAPGYQTWEKEEVLIGPGNTTHLPTIRLQPASQITGTVISSSSGKPVQGALVRVLDDTKKDVVTVNRIELKNYDRSDIIEYLDAAYDEDYKYDPDPNTRLIARVRGNVITTLQTNVYGKFDVNDLSDGVYTLEFEHPLYRPKLIRNIHVGRTDTQDLGQIELEPGGTVRGTVTDLEGNGISNAAVQIKGELQGRNRARTDIGGNFTLRGIGYGQWPVVVQATLDGRKIYAWKNVSVRPDNTSILQFVLEVSANVSGRVTMAGGAVKSGTVKLYAIDERGAVLDDYVYSDNLSSGRFDITKVPPGQYFATATGRGPQGNFAISTWASISRGNNQLDFPAATSALQGNVKDVVTGGAVGSATVQAVMDTPGGIVPGTIQTQLRLSVRTNAAGHFSLPHLQPGTYRIWAAAPGHTIAPVDAVTIQGGQNIKGYTISVQGGGI